MSGKLAKKLCYSARPNRYFDDRAESVAKLYDGFFFKTASSIATGTATRTRPRFT